MSDRRKSDRRDLERDASSDDKDRRGQDHDRRVLERFSNESIKVSSEKMLLWFRVLFVASLAVGLFVLGSFLSRGVRVAGPGIFISALLFSFSYFVHTTRASVKSYLENESLVVFEVLFERLNQLVSFIGLFTGFALLLFIATSI